MFYYKYLMPTRDLFALYLDNTICLKNEYVIKCDSERLCNCARQLNFALGEPKTVNETAN